MKVQDAKYISWDMRDLLLSCDAYNGGTKAGASYTFENALTRLQLDLAAWQERNFKLSGDVKPLMLTLGVIEEGMGELAAAHEPSEIVDAVGDTLIFLAQLGSHYGFSIADLILYPRSVSSSASIQSALATLAQVVLKLEQNIRGKTILDVYNAIGSVISTLKAYKNDLGMCFINTAKAVLKRDWVANPTNGLKTDGLK